MYAFLLTHMTDELRFSLTAKLCTETLAAFLDGAMDVGGERESSVLEDVLFVLSSEV